MGNLRARARSPFAFAGEILASRARRCRRRSGAVDSPRSARSVAIDQARLDGSDARLVALQRPQVVTELLVIIAEVAVDIGGERCVDRSVEAFEQPGLHCGSRS
ncbi:MAG: hypothetical protein WKF58_00645 [Ilumatobacteraceae bacterium]